MRRPHFSTNEEVHNGYPKRLSLIFLISYFSSFPKKAGIPKDPRFPVCSLVPLPVQSAWLRRKAGVS